MLFLRLWHLHSSSTFSYSNCSMLRQCELQDSKALLVFLRWLSCQQWYLHCNKSLIKWCQIWTVNLRSWECRQKIFWKICHPIYNRRGSRSTNSMDIIQIVVVLLIPATSLWSARPKIHRPRLQPPLNLTLLSIKSHLNYHSVPITMNLITSIL